MRVYSKRGLSFFLFSLSLLVNLPALAENEEQPTMNLQIVSDVPIILWYKKYMVKAYSRLNYRVSFIELPAGRGTVEAQKGVNDALTVRISAIEKLFPDYIRIPVLLAEGELVLYCQLHLPCDKDILNDSENIIGINSGGNFTSFFMKNKKASVYQVKNGNKAGLLLTKNRLDYILTIDSPAFGNYVNIVQEDFQRVSLTSFKAYHYLHKRHKELVPQLTQELHTAINEIGPISAEFLESIK